MTNQQPQQQPQPQIILVPQPTPETYRKAARRIAKARTRLLLKREFVFWATCALHLRPVPYTGMVLVERGPIGVDGTHMFYDPEWIANGPWNEDELIGVIAHEVSHCVKGDTWRRGVRDPVKWNIAADMRINPELIKAGLTLPNPHLGADSDLGRAAEEIYQALLNNPSGGQGQEGRNGNYGNCGEVLDAGSNPNGDADSQAPNQSAAQAAQAAQDQARRWEVIARQAANIAKSRGHLPAGYEYLIEPVRPKLDPWALLRHFVSMCRRDDYSWSRGNRRYLHSGIYLPSLWSEGVGELLIAADVSGSTGSVWPQFAGFLNACLTEVKPEKVWFVECDCVVQHVTEFGPGEQLPEQITIHGGGGTNMRPIWDWADEHNVRPVCAIVLSDMEMDERSFGEPQDYPVLWVSSEPGRIAPWGETVELQ